MILKFMLERMSLPGNFGVSGNSVRRMLENLPAAKHFQCFF